MQAAELLRLVSGALQDLEPGIRARWEWNGGDDNAVGLLDFLNHALREVVMQRPDATAVTGDIVLEPEARREGARHAVYRSECERVRWKDGQADHGDHHGEHHGVGVDGHVRSVGRNRVFRL